MGGGGACDGVIGVGGGGEGPLSCFRQAKEATSCVSLLLGGSGRVQAKTTVRCRRSVHRRLFSNPHSLVFL